MFNPIKWLFEKNQPETEEITVSEPVTDITTVTTAPVTVTETATVAATPADEAKAGVQDFEAALAFVESGVKQLGEAAKDELKALAVKYL